MKFAILLSFVLINIVTGLKLPAAFPRCRVSKATDNKPDKCLEDAITKAVQHLAENGDSGLGVLDLDPLRITEMVLSQGDTGRPVSIDLTFRNIDLIGLSKVNLKYLDGKVSSPDKFYISLAGFLPEIQLLGEYTIKGNILVLPITGTGKCNIKLGNLKPTGMIFASRQIKNGKEYLKLDNLKLVLNLEKVSYKFDNLFNGNKELGDNMNRFMNENSLEIFEELRPSIEEAISKVLEEYSRRILERVQFKNIFILE